MWLDLDGQVSVKKRKTGVARIAVPALLVLLMALAVLVIFDYPDRSVPGRLFRLQAGRQRRRYPGWRGGA
jgi:hypothetical protein